MCIGKSCSFGLVSDFDTTHIKLTTRIIVLAILEWNIGQPISLMPNGLMRLAAPNSGAPIAAVAGGANGWDVVDASVATPDVAAASGAALKHLKVDHVKKFEYCLPLIDWIFAFLVFLAVSFGVGPVDGVMLAQTLTVKFLAYRNGLKYMNSAEVLKDVQYIWSNCEKYNKKDDHILELMNRVKTYFIKYWKAAGLHMEQIIAVVIYLSTNILSRLLFLLPFIRQNLEISDYKVVKLVRWWSQVIKFNGMSSSLKVIKFKNPFSLCICLTSENVANSSFSNIGVVITLWAPIILVGTTLCSNTYFKRRLCNIVWTDKIEPETFDEKLVAIMDEFSLNKNKWLSDMFEMHDRWNPAYFRNEPMSGLMCTTSSSESENHFFGQLTSTRLSLVEFIGLLVEKEAVELYTTTLFYDVQEEIYSSLMH
ncbi:FAR1 DNA binding domain, zinc finger, SWIM-type, MULE transposase domain containing protein [Tanacetum coccineum]